MTIRTITVGAAVLGVAIAGSPAQAQSHDLNSEVAQLRAEVEALRAEIRAIREQSGGTAPSMTPTPSPPSAAVTAAQKPQPGDVTQIVWKGAPEFRSEGGWSFKPRGRLQLDGSYLEAPESRTGGQGDGRHFTSELRRAYLGFQGTIPGGFGYRAEVDLGGNSVEWTDLYLTYDKGPLNITFGQHYPFPSLEQMTSDLFTTFTERAAFTGAFNQERRIGLSAGYRTSDIMFNAGVFTDDVTALNNDGNGSVSIDARLVWMPKAGDTQFHLGVSAHRRTLGEVLTQAGTQYRQRPYIHSADIRFVDTGSLKVNKETNYGLEAAIIRRGFHAVAEGAWMRASRIDGADPTFFGGYAEVGYFLTSGDKRGYRTGAFDRVVPQRPVGGGGIGAIEFNIRYDHLDLTDAGVEGGKQDGLGASLVWTPTAYLRFIADYMHLSYDIPGPIPQFNANAVGLRGQIDF